MFSATCKRFFMILTTYKDYKWTVSISKCIFNFDDYYTEFLLNAQMFDSKKAIQNKFKEEEIKDEIFPIIDLKTKIISSEFTPFKVFCHCFFCSRGSRSIDTCSICSRIFVDKSDVSRKIDSSFVVTIKSLENLDVCDLMKYLKVGSVVLNIHYLAIYFSSWSQNFNEIFVETANTPFAFYALFVQIYRIYVSYRIYNLRILIWPSQSQRLILKILWWENILQYAVWKN